MTLLREHGIHWTPVPTPALTESARLRYSEATQPGFAEFQPCPNSLRPSPTRASPRNRAPIFPSLLTLPVDGLGKSVGLDCYGPWADPNGALDRYLAAKGYLHAGRTPPVAVGEGPSFRDIVKVFLTTK